MKQPEIGKKVAALRKEKGMTQEELVEKCNINVRTIQRIESGEVTPRPITLRLILEALNYNFEMLNHEINDEATNSSVLWVRQLQKIFLIGFDLAKNKRISAKILQVAWIAGLVGFILGFPESGMEYAQYNHHFNSSDLNTIYTLVKAASFIAMVIMLRGFIVLGDFHRNFLMKITAYLMIIHGLFTSLYYIVTAYSPDLHSQYADSGVSITYGTILMLFGISLRKIGQQIGPSATIAGILAVIASVLFITLIFWWVGLLLLIPIKILEIVILYKGYELLMSDIKSFEI